MSLVSILQSYNQYEKIKNNFKFDELLSSYTFFKIGGKAELLYEPSDKEELKAMCNFFIEHKIDVSIIGNASNLLISDSGLKGAIIHLNKFNECSVLKREGEHIFVNVGAGLIIDEFIEFCIENEISGIEDFAGLPASIGGAIFMNAKCFETSMSKLVKTVDYLKFSTTGCTFETYSMSEKDWDYKKSPFQKDSSGIKLLENRNIITSCILKLKKGNKDQIKGKSEERYNTRVLKKQFDFPSAGCVFKNDYTCGIPTGKLVSEASLLGLSKGGAQIAPWHGNFIINRGNASSNDVLYIMNVVREEIKKRYGIVLEPEVIYCY